MNDDSVWLTMAIYRLAADLISAPIKAEHARKLHMALQDVVVSATHVLGKDRDHQRSCDEEYRSLFDEILRQAGHTNEECVKAHNVRKGVMRMAQKLLDDSDLRRSDDPPNCDPGGGMRSPDDIRDNDDSENDRA